MYVCTGRIGASTDVVVTVLVAAEVVVVVVVVSCGDVTKSEVDERVGKRVDCGVGRLEMLLRLAIGLLFGLLIVTDNRANSAVMYSVASSERLTVETASQRANHSCSTLRCAYCTF